MRARVFAVILAVLILPAAAHAQTPAQLLESTLNKALAERRYDDFDRTMLETKSAHELVRAATWMRERVLAGDGSFLVRAYAASLWRALGNKPPAPVRETAVVMAVYLNSIIVLDGFKCADRSASPERLQQVSVELAPLLDHLRGMARDRQTFVLDTAFRIEERLAGKRGDDDWLCRAGLNGMMSALKGGVPVQEVPGRPGRPGRTVQVQPDPAYMPVFRPRAEWEPEQRTHRSKLQSAMRASLLQ